MHRPLRPPAVLAAAALLVACVRAAPGPAAAPAPDAATAGARAAIAAERTLRPDTFPAHSVGVAPMAVRDGDSTIAPLGYGLADLLLTDLSRSAQLQVVDRVRTDALLRELALAQSGRVDSATAPRVGKLVGARQLVFGALAERPDGSLELTTRVAEVQTGQITAGGTASAPLDRILDAEKALAFRIFDELGVTLTPAERAAVEQRPTGNLAALLAYSRAVRDETTGNDEAAAAEYAQAARLDPAFSLAQTRRTQLQSRHTSIGPSVRGTLARRAARRARLRRASRLTVGEINHSGAERLGRHDAAGGASDPAFLDALTANVIVILRTLP